MNTDLRARDGHQLSAYVAEPPRAADKAVVVIQEIFGVNSHIRSVADDYARYGFLAVAPALFDRVERGVELAYDQPGTERGLAISRKIGLETALTDVSAALDYAAMRVGSAHAGVVGYCWGGSLAWLAATRLQSAASVGYYGGKIAEYARETPHCPVMLHFGRLDKGIPESSIDAVRQQHPGLPIFVYEAGHGFNCDRRASFDLAAATLARERTHDFLRQHLGPSASTKDAG